MPGSPREKTAVVVIHGIGEQLPMETVRGLVDTLYGDGSGGLDGKPVLNKVDRLSRTLDLRRLSIPSSRNRGRTDFYELYWAAYFGVGTVGGVLGWAAQYLRRRPVGSKFRVVVVWARVMLALAIVLAVAVVLLGLGGWVRAAAASTAGVVALLVVRRFLGGVFTRTLADASRWFAPRPDDVPARDEVRRIGLELLERLHEPDKNGDPRYDRIVVVGHSLGSVIGYDVLRLAFDQLRVREGDWPDIPLLMDFNSAAEVLALVDDYGAAAVEAFQEYQHCLHDEQCAAGVSWRVTDFVTVGSPLTHARDLWSSRRTPFERRIIENEFPMCPPRGEYQDREDATLPWYRKDGTVQIHEASMFGSTRWTNLYVPVTPTLGGDPVGGPVAPVFGAGVRDVPVALSYRPGWSRRVVMALPAAAHTRYWTRGSPVGQRADGHADGGRVDTIYALKEAIGLNAEGEAPNL